jgi:hypothetical protein
MLSYQKAIDGQLIVGICARKIKKSKRDKKSKMKREIKSKIKNQREIKFHMRERRDDKERPNPKNHK